MVIRGRALSEKEKWLFEGEANVFEEYLAAILGIKDTRIKYAALRVAISALRIGYYHADRAAVVSEISTKVRN
jgi:hypothetical protein